MAGRNKAHVLFFAAIAALMATCTGSLGCGEEKLGFELRAYFPCNHFLKDDNPLSPPARYAEVCLNYSQQDLDAECKVTAVSSAGLDIPNLRTGRALRVSIEARATKGRGEPIAFAQSQPMIADESSLQKTTMMLSLVDRFATATNNTNCKGRSCACSKMMVPRKDFTATVLHDGRILLVGGMDDQNNVLDNGEVFDPETGTFEWTKNRMVGGRVGHVAIRLGRDYGYKVLIVGGEGEQQWKVAEYYNPESNRFETIGKPMMSSRVHLTGTRLNDGRVLLVGGYKGAGTKTYLDNMEIFDPVNNNFVAVMGNMSEGRAYHTATLTTVGRGQSAFSQVLVAGGLRQGTVLKSADVIQIQDGMTDADVKTIQMKDKRWGHAAARVGMGDKVLIVGGSNNAAGAGVGTLNSIEMFDGFSAKDFVAWNPLDTPTLKTGRFGPTLTELEASSGNAGVTRALVVIGGLNSATPQPSTIGSVELIIPDNPADPTSFSVDSTSARIIRDTRVGHQSVRLPNGMVISMGGLYRDSMGNFAVLDSAEIYNPGPAYWCGSKACSN
ncbi:MAG: hypothetical protein GXP49_01300 [Deltaproteobacteria bacterium]|nr:hypothetical protein [Deltaproteobacteria bacterium]